MSFKAKIKRKNTGQIDTDTALIKGKLLECSFVDDCVLKERASCNLTEFPDFLNCPEYQTKKSNLFRNSKEYVKIKSVK